MGSLNRVMLVGRLGKDPECRTVQGGTQMATFSVATSDRYKDKSGQYQETTEWHRVVVWGQQADFATKYLQKGRQVYVEGRLRSRTYETRDGETRVSLDVSASEVRFIDSPGGRTDEFPPSEGAPPEGNVEVDDLPF